MAKYVIILIVFLMFLAGGCDLDKKKSNGKVTQYTVSSINRGDIMCYVVLSSYPMTDTQHGAIFDFCDQRNKYIGKKVIIEETKIINVNDCESIEPCGKTKKVKLITKLKVVK